MIRILSTVLMIFLTAAASSLAQELDPAESLNEKITKLNREVESQEDEVAKLEAKSRKLEQELKSLKLEVAKLQSEETESEAAVKRLDEELAYSRDELEKINLHIEESEAVSKERVRALYIHPPTKLVGTLLKRSNSSSFSHLGYYLLTIRSHDMRQLEEITDLKRSRSEMRGQLDDLSTKQLAQLQIVKQKKASLAQKLVDQKNIAVLIQKQRKEREALLIALRARLLRFETVMASLTGGKSDSEDSEKGKSSTESQVRQFQPEAYQGDGLAPHSAIAPAERAELVVPYGPRKKGADGSQGSSKGIEFLAPPGSLVRAIDDGKVLFIGKIPSVGPIVIVDHGERYYSLYGRMTKIEVEQGASLEKGATIGEVGDEVNGKNLYFELRKGGIPIDPAGFLTDS